MTEEESNKKKIESVEEKMRRFYAEKEEKTRESYQKVLYDSVPALTDAQVYKKEEEDRKRKQEWKREEDDRARRERNELRNKQQREQREQDEIKERDIKNRSEDQDSEEKFWENYRKEIQNKR